MGGYREPPSVAASPDVGITAIPLLAVCRGVAGARVNDSDIAENAHSHFLRREVTDPDRSSGLCKELALVDERPVGVRTQEVLGQDLIEPLHIAMLYRMDTVAVERGQRIDISSRGCVSLHGHLHGEILLCIFPVFFWRFHGFSSHLFIPPTHWRKGELAPG